jgi:hypothetical protein
MQFVAIAIKNRAITYLADLHHPRHAVVPGQRPVHLTATRLAALAF